MTQFRASKTLIKQGVTEKQQGLIFFMCANAARLDKGTQKKIHSICEAVGKEDCDALYRFLTDIYVNHDYICQNYYISKTRLFKLKREFYLKFNEN